MSRPVSLADALELGERSVVALAGAGGKTTSMWSLVRALSRRGTRVACTTTTRIGLGEQPAGVEVVPWRAGGALDALEAVLASGRVPLVMTSVTPDGKLAGLAIDQADELASHVDHLIVEADGARRRPLKIPRAHEPATPASATHLVVVAGLAALGRPAGPDVLFHHEELVARGLVGDGQTLDARTIRSLLMGGHGYLDRMRPGLRSFVMVNGADREGARALARELWHPRLEAAVAADARNDLAVRVTNAAHRVAAVVLAAGLSTRFGSNKLVVEVGEEPMVRLPVRAGLEAGIEDIVVVLGHEAEEVRKALGELAFDRRVRLALNPSFAKGMGTSLAAGVRACRDGADAVVVLLGDMPGVGPGLVAGVLDAYRAGAAVAAAPATRGRTGHPVVLGSALFDRIEELDADVGARDLLAAVQDRISLVALASPSSQRDVDGPDA